jgi:hypothetical protein
VGELTGDSELPVEGAVQQAKGNFENAWGKAKDAVREANQEATVQHDKNIYVLTTRVTSRLSLCRNLAGRKWNG